MMALLAWGLALVLSVPFLLLCAELAAGLWPASATAPPCPMAQNEGTPPRVTILMPAHDEAAGIAATIEALAGERGDRVRLLVVADNCTDDTALVARGAGAMVIERQDPANRGKGHALAFGRDWLKADPPDCVVVLDADCTVEPGTIGRLARASLAWGRPVQGCYRLRGGGDGPMVEISNFAFLIKNAVRQRGSARFGAAAVLGGTGMAFPWPLFAGAPLATSDLVEDLALGVHFANIGQPPRYLATARIWSEAATAGDTLTQRTRWEHGFLDTARRHALPLIGHGLAGRRPALLGLGLHLLVPPLALLMMAGLSALGLLLALAMLGSGWGPALWLGGLLIGCAGLLFAAWRREGRAVMAGRTLLRVPLYLLWKLPVYARLLYRRQTEWVRTRRK